MERNYKELRDAGKGGRRKRVSQDPQDSPRFCYDGCVFWHGTLKRLITIFGNL